VIGLLIWLAVPAAQEFPARLEWAIEYGESRGDTWAKRGPCRGLWQVNPAFASPTVRKAPALLYTPEVGRAEGRRHLAGWLKVCHGDLNCALRGYRCGYDGVKGLCGKDYAAAVQRRAKKAHWSVDYLADHCRACPECCVYP